MMIQRKNPIETHSNFIFNVPGKNLDKNNPIFTVKKLIHNFMADFDYLFETNNEGPGRPKKYKIEDLLGLIIGGKLNNKNSYRELENWCKNNDETCNYVSNNIQPSKSTICAFMINNSFLIEEFFYYLVQIAKDYDLIGFKNVTIDGTVFKANASNHNIIRLYEIKFLENLIQNFYQIESNENLLFKLQKYYIGGILDENNKEFIEYINSKLNIPAIKLLMKLLYNTSEISDILGFLKYLKSNYDGKNSISMNDPECRWMLDKKGNIGLNYNYQVAIDDKNDFIVAQKIINDKTDHHQLIPNDRNSSNEFRATSRILHCRQRLFN